MWLFSLTKRQMNGIFAPIVHAILYCIELSSNLNLKSNCQYKIRCQSHFYLFFVGVCGVRCARDEIWWTGGTNASFLLRWLHCQFQFIYCRVVCARENESLMSDIRHGFIQRMHHAPTNQSWFLPAVHTKQQFDNSPISDRINKLSSAHQTKKMRKKIVPFNVRIPNKVQCH